MESVSQHHAPQASDAGEGSLFEALDHIEHDVSDLVEALSLLGIKRCGQCRKFFRVTEPGALFDSGELVCYACLPEWWSSVSERTRVQDREKLEGRLSSWLRKYHHAEVVREETGKADITDDRFQLVVHCNECRGSGKLLEGERCRFCNGLGTVRLVAPR